MPVLESNGGSPKHQVQLILPAVSALSAAYTARVSFVMLAFAGGTGELEPTELSEADLMPGELEMPATTLRYGFGYM